MCESEAYSTFGVTSLVAIAVPVAGKVMSVAAHQLRERRGPNQFADRLDQGAALIRRVSRLV